MFKNPANLKKNIEHLMEDNIMMSKEVQGMKKSALTIEKRNIIDSAKEINGISLMACRVKPVIADQLKDLAHSISNETDQDIALVLGGEVKGKPQLAILFSEKLIKEYDLNAGTIVREAAKRMQGGGGGQPFFATAGGKNLDGLDTAIEEAVAIIQSKLEA